MTKDPPPLAKSYRILIVDDHPVVRRGLRSLLANQPGLEVWAEASTGAEAIELVKRGKPDLVILDLTMPEMDGLAASQKIRAEVPETDILVLTMHFADEIARDALRSGARGYILKSDADTELVAAIERIRHHGTFFTAQLADSMAERFLREPGEGEPGPIPGAPLTPRELEIVHYLASGKSNKEVAAMLKVSTRTVESHRNHIMHKMNFTSFSELVRFAIR
ncbi:MAG: response regulator transcription factor, partial [Candidatus Acidiferrales bacterium]